MQLCVEWNERTYTFDPERDLTVQRLRVLKGKFGPDYGRYVTLLNLAAEGDADALTGLLWVMRSLAGDSVDPTAVGNFSAGAFYFAYLAAVTEATKRDDAEDGPDADRVDPTSESDSSEGSTQT